MNNSKVLSVIIFSMLSQISLATDDISEKHSEMDQQHVEASAPAPEAAVSGYSDVKFPAIQLHNFPIQYNLNSRSDAVRFGTKRASRVHQLEQIGLVTTNKDMSLRVKVTRDPNTPAPRIEFREYPTLWDMEYDNALELSVKLHPSEAKEYTWAQIHRKTRASKVPPMRLVWVKEKMINGRVFKDFLVAVLYGHETNNKDYEIIPLMKRPEGKSDFVIYLVHNRLTVAVDKDPILIKKVDGWDDNNYYFRAGVYMSGGRSGKGNYAGTGLVDIYKLKAHHDTHKHNSSHLLDIKNLHNQAHDSHSHDSHDSHDHHDSHSGFKIHNH